MSKLKLLISLTAIITIISVHANTAVFMASDGEYEFTVFESGVDISRDQKASGSSITTYIELVEKSTEVDSQREVVASETTFEIEQSIGKIVPGVYPVIQKSTLELVVEEKKRNEPDLYFLKMKKGTVKFFNNIKTFRTLVNTDFPDTKVTYYGLVLPDDLSDVIDAALIRSDRVIIIFRTNDGKKGLNAVNVKKA